MTKRFNGSYEEHLATTIYYDRHFSLQASKILPGEYFVTNTNMVLVTVLGSCVAACIRDTENHIGGMNHFMLPDDGGRHSPGHAARYGAYAMEILINHLLKLGAQRHRLEAKVFGGGAVLEGSNGNVGVRNAEFVLNFLQTERIPIIAKDLLDSHPRKVYFFPQTGKVLLKRLHQVHNETLLKRERHYKAWISNIPIAGDIELFS